MSFDMDLVSLAMTFVLVLGMLIGILIGAAIYRPKYIQSLDKSKEDFK